MADTAEVRYRIGMVAGGFMVAAALVADLLQILLTLTAVLALAADLVTFIAEASLGLWFLIMGVNFFGGKKSLSTVITALSTTVVELVPVIDALPTLTIATVFIIRNSRTEDREKFKASKPKVQNPNPYRARYQAANDNLQAKNDNGPDEERVEAA